MLWQDRGPLVSCAFCQNLEHTPDTSAVQSGQLAAIEDRIHALEPGAQSGRHAAGIRCFSWSLPVRSHVNQGHARLQETLAFGSSSRFRDTRCADVTSSKERLMEMLKTEHRPGALAPLFFASFQLLGPGAGTEDRSQKVPALLQSGAGLSTDGSK